MQRTSENIEAYFSYELTAEPAPLFKDCRLRKTDKSQLAKELVKGIELSTVNVQGPRPVHIVDGGCLLHTV
jgi:hypothetical protein